MARNALYFLVLTAFCICLLPVSASATACGFTSTLTVSSQTAAGATNGTDFGTVCVVLTSSTTATVTFTSATNYAFMDSSMNDVQVNASSFTLGTTITESPNAGFASDGGSGNVSSWGVFNQTINNFDGASDAETSVVFTLTNNSGTWASAANVLTANGSGYDAAAHIICLAGSGCEAAGSNGSALTFFAAETAATPIPEPSTMLLFGSGIVGVLNTMKRKLRG